VVAGTDGPGPQRRARAFGGKRKVDLQAEFDAARDRFEATNAKIEERAGRNLFLAGISGVVFGALILASLLWFVEIFAVLAAVLMTAASVELAIALRSAGRRVPLVGSGIAALGVVTASYLLGAQGLWWSSLAACVFVVAWRLVDAAAHRGSAGRAARLGRDLLTSVFVVLYVTVLGAFTELLALRDAGQGRWWVLGMIIIVVAADTGAYAAGVTLGRHKMVPTISPNKSWEGFAGAALTAIAGGILVGVPMLGIPWWQGLVLGIVLLLTATIGDLTESLVKRDLGIKDMSNWIPGHGGLLDRVDSILPSGAAAFALSVIFAR